MLIRRADVSSKPKRHAFDLASSHRRLWILLIVQLNSNVLSFGYTCDQALPPCPKTASACALPETASACTLHCRLWQEITTQVRWP